MALSAAGSHRFTTPFCNRKDFPPVHFVFFCRLPSVTYSITDFSASHRDRMSSSQRSALCRLPSTCFLEIRTVVLSGLKPPRTSLWHARASATWPPAFRVSTSCLIKLSKKLLTGSTAAPPRVHASATLGVNRPGLLWGEKRFYEVTAQPNIVIVSTTSSKPMLTRLSTFPCPSR